MKIDTLTCEYDCDETAVVMITWWDKGIIDLSDMDSVKVIRSCARHFTNIAVNVNYNLTSA